MNFKGIELPPAYYQDDWVYIIQGDCREILPDISDKSIDLVLTDPPYGISQKSNGLRELDYGEWDKNIDTESIANLLISTNATTLAIWCGDEQLSTLLTTLKDNQYLTRTLAWCKTNPTVINGDKLWLPSMELCAWGKQRGGYFNGNCLKGYFMDAPDTIRYHPSQKPVLVLEHIVQASCNNYGLVLDPYMGSGSSLVAAKKLNRYCRRKILRDSG